MRNNNLLKTLTVILTLVVIAFPGGRNSRFPGGMMSRALAQSDSVETLPAPQAEPTPDQTDTQTEQQGTISILGREESSSSGAAFDETTDEVPFMLRRSAEDPSVHNDQDSAVGSATGAGKAGIGSTRADVDGSDHYDVLSRGPLHEAFAKPYAGQGIAVSPVIPQSPPEPLEEIPPGTVPQGNNVQWISGYWAWDPVSSDYVWVTGIYRDAPPGRTWKAGYWTDAPDGYRWVSGYWMESRAENTRYLPSPPGLPSVSRLWAAESIPGPAISGSAAARQATDGQPNASSRPDRAPIGQTAKGSWGPEGSGGAEEVVGQTVEFGPDSPAPNEDSFWVPGHWAFQDGDYGNGNYQWQSGFWTEQYENWIWTPAHYIGTPRGYVFVPGFWDYEPTARGVIYAPLIFRTAAYRRPEYRLLPVYRLLDTQYLVLHLFVLRDSPTFYVGDYYTNALTARGFRPWYATDTSFATASMLSYYRWKYARAEASDDFKRSLLDYYQWLRTTPAARPTIARLSTADNGILTAGRGPVSSREAVASSADLTLNDIAAGRLGFSGSSAVRPDPIGGISQIQPRAAGRNLSRGMNYEASDQAPGPGSPPGQNFNRLRSNAFERGALAGENAGARGMTDAGNRSRRNTASGLRPAEQAATPFDGRPILSRMYRAAVARGAVPPGFAPPFGMRPGMTPPTAPLGIPPRGDSLQGNGTQRSTTPGIRPPGIAAPPGIGPPGVRPGGIFRGRRGR